MDQPGVAARRSTGSCFLRPFQPSESSHIWRTGSGVTEATAAAEKVVVRPEATVPGIHYLWRTSHHDEFNLELQPGEARSWEGALCVYDKLQREICWEVGLLEQRGGRTSKHWKSTASAWSKALPQSPFTPSTLLLQAESICGHSIPINELIDTSERQTWILNESKASLCRIPQIHWCQLAGCFVLCGK